MAQDTGMFGPAPWQIQQHQLQQDATNAQNFTQMNAAQRGVQGMYQGGAGLARLGAGAMGMVNPAEQQAKMRQTAMAGINPDDPASIRAKAVEIGKFDPQLAMQLGVMANQREAEMSKIGLEKAQTKKAGNPSWKIKTIKVGEDKIQDVQWDETGQYEDVMLGEPYKKDDDGGGSGGKGGSVRYESIINPITKEEKIVHVSQVNQYLAQGWQHMKFSPGVAGSMSGAKVAAKGEAEVASKLDDKVFAGKQALPKIDNILTMLDTGKLNVGPGSEINQAIDRAKIFFLNSKKSGQYASDTEILDSMLGSEVFGMIQSLGIGARGMDTPAEREFLLNVMSGRLPLTKETLRAMALRRKGEINRDIATLSSMKQSGEYDSRTGNRGGAPKKTKKFNPATNMWEES